MPLGLQACTDTSPVPAVTAGPVPAGTVDAGDAQAAVDRLFAAGVAGARPDWDARVFVADDAAASRLSLLFDNLHALAPARLRLRLTGVEQQLPAVRRVALGPDARVVQARLDWRLPGERAGATSTVWLTLVPGTTGARLAGTDDGPAGGTDDGVEPDPVPLWWLAPTARATRGDVTVLVGPGQDAARWLDLAVRAAADARTHLPEPLRAAWDGHLVLEVPGSGADLARVLGAPPTTYATTAAVTRPEGPTTDAAVRVVVNPATAAQPDDALGATLVHETVHVATRSAASPAPLWAVEGLAEHVALAAHPDQRVADLAALRAGAAPRRLPADAAFAAGSADVGAAYAQAWLVCEAVADRRGETGLGHLYAALDAGTPVDEAARETLGVDEARLVDWWREALRRAVPDGGG